MKKVKLRKGAVGFADLLGFKGIWQHTDPTSMFFALEQLEADIRRNVQPDSKEARQQTWTISNSSCRIRLFFLSDCLCVTALARDDFSQNSNPLLVQLDAMYAVNLALSIAQASATQLPHPLTMRGSISVGELALSKNYMMGPAVDDAAMHMNQPDAAVVCLTPTALSFWSQFLSSQFLDEVKRRHMWSWHRFDDLVYSLVRHMVHNYEIPLKRGTMNGSVVNPLIANGWGRGVTVLRDSMLATFDTSDQTIERKRLHTQAFLTAAEQWIKRVDKPGIDPVEQLRLQVSS